MALRRMVPHVSFPLFGLETFMDPPSKNSGPGSGAETARVASAPDPLHAPDPLETELSPAADRIAAAEWSRRITTRTHGSLGFFARVVRLRCQRTAVRSGSDGAVSCGTWNSCYVADCQRASSGVIAVPPDGRTSSTLS
jgi:hypothetical protein